MKQSLFVTSPNEPIAKIESVKYNNILEEFIEANIAKLITSFIVHKSNYLKWINFDRIIDEHNGIKAKRYRSNSDPWRQTEQDQVSIYKDAKSQTHFSFNDHIVDFSNARRDVVSIRTDLLSTSTNPSGRYYINVYCMEKDDEAWIGLTKKKTYPKAIWWIIRSNEHGLLYYGGREWSISRFGGA